MRSHLPAPQSGSGAACCSHSGCTQKNAVRRQRSVREVCGQCGLIAPRSGELASRANHTYHLEFVLECSRDTQAEYNHNISTGRVHIPGIQPLRLPANNYLRPSVPSPATPPRPSLSNRATSLDRVASIAICASISTSLTMSGLRAICQPSSTFSSTSVPPSQIRSVLGSAVVPLETSFGPTSMLDKGRARQLSLWKPRAHD